MKLSELIEELEDIQSQFGEDVDPSVNIAYQPNWPLTESVGAVASSGDEDEDEDEFAQQLMEEEGISFSEAKEEAREYIHGENKKDKEPTIYIAPSGYGGNEYLPGEICRKLGWA